MSAIDNVITGQVTDRQRLLAVLAFAFGGMMPTFVSLAAGEPSNIPMSLAGFCFAACALFMIGAIVAGETKGTQLHG